MLTDPGAGAGVGEEEAEARDQQTPYDGGKGPLQQGEAAERHQGDPRQQQALRPKAMGTAAAQGGGEGAGEVGQKQHAEPLGRQGEGGLGQQEGEVAVLVQEDHEVEPADEIGPQQQGIAEVALDGAAQLPRCGLHGHEAGLGR
ncbi:hypothetical protein D3C76_421710 [compost metagenome]